MTITPTTGSTTLYSENFDGLTAGAAASGWTNTIGTWQVVASNAVTSPNAFYASTKTDGNTSLQTGITAVSDMEITYSQIITATATQMPSICPLLRCNSAFTQGYLLVLTRNTTGYAAGSVRAILYKRVSTSFNLIGTINSLPIGIGTNDVAGVRVQATGTTIQFKIWSNSGAEPSTWTGSWTDSTYTSAGYAGLYYSLDGSATGTVTTVDDITINQLPAANTVITPDNSGIIYSPYNWDISSVRAKSVNSGAYLRTCFTGNTLSLSFDTTNNSAPVSQVFVKVDNGAWASYTLANTITPTIPGDNAWAKHLLQVVIKSTSETINRWNSPQNTAVLFNGLILTAGSTATAPEKQGINVLFFGDSITEGVRTLTSNAGVTDVFRNDVFESWDWKLSQMLGVEFGIVGFGAQGWTTTGSGNVPVLGTAYSSLWAGTARSFTPSPNLVVLNMGQNDGAVTNTVTAATAFLNNLLTACPVAKIAVLRPFSGNQAANLQAAIAACSDPQRCVYIDTTGFLDTTLSSDSVHPFGVANDAIAKKLFPLIKPLIAAAYPGGFIGI